MEACPNSAFYRAERLRINLLKCNACRKCIALCEHGAVTFGREVTIKSREIDLKNLSDLKKIQGIKAVRSPEELYNS